MNVPNSEKKGGKLYTDEEKKKFLEEAIRNGGFYTNDGCWNSIMKFDNDDHIYRGRVETLIIKDGDSIFLRWLPKDNKNETRTYLIPGGSLSKDVSNADQAINECREEARINVTNIRSSGITYKEYKDPPKWSKNRLPVNWNGNYTEVYIADFDSYYDGFINKTDIDSFMVKGKFFPIKSVYSQLRKEHKDALNAVYKNEIVTEGYLRDAEDIYYNKEKFDSGEINLCFITGHVGSGKSTMGRNMATKENTEHYELDVVIDNKYFYTMENLKEYGDMMYSFFNGIGKKYYYTHEDIVNGTVDRIDNYDDKIINDFCKYAMSYAKSHPRKKYIVEGIELWESVEPSILKDFAVYIKGTSRIKSDIRASKRDSMENGKDPKTGKIIKDVLRNTLSLRAVKAEKGLRKYRNYFKNKVNEETITESANFMNNQAVKSGYIESTAESVKTEATLTAAQRREIPDNQFGIPSQRRYPLNDKNHVIAAIRMFNRVDRKHEKELAYNIIKAMKQYNINTDIIGDANRLKSYIR